MKLKKLFYHEKIIQTDQDPERILCSLRSAAFPSKYNLFSKDAFHFKAGAARGGNRLYIAFHVRGKVVPDFSSHRNHVVFSVQPPLCSYIGLMLFTAAAVYSFISLLIYPHALPVCLSRKGQRSRCTGRPAACNRIPAESFWKSENSSCH